MIQRINLKLPGVTADLEGLTVGVLSDLHAGMLCRGERAVRSLVELVNEVGVDLLALLGDMVHRAGEADVYLPLLGELRAPLGVWACLGNHERARMWYSRYLGPGRCPSVAEWRRKYAEAGMNLLVNEAAAIPVGASRLWVVGVDDSYSGLDDLGAALQTVEGSGFRLCLSHSPNLLDDPHCSEVDLVLAGHTHGGQVWVPGLGPFFVSCRRPRERAAGIVRDGDTVAYVTRGVGEGVPLRLGCPRELPLITLRRV